MVHGLGGSVRSWDLIAPLLSDARELVIIDLPGHGRSPAIPGRQTISAFADANPDVTVIGIAVQDTESASRSFAAEIEASYPLALSEPGFEEDYPWIGLPATYVIDGSGRIAVVHNGIVDRDGLIEMTEDL